ncbi:hypothetical protein [Ancylobacter oerskovii]|uniref:Uncharacterized protein n=1 Tax=Ancylobacter oerskovii TaxID=459519 RepID=A0ABW4YYU2_9HYPH|nr:hypothetical protein [Ancylobacter oerskovii]MBS7544001.1 hypothetical protein [Ancylobacter oerskovii]
MPEVLHITGAHIKLSANLVLRFGAPLSAIWMGSYFLNILLLRGAVEIGLLSRFAGLIALAPIILLQLLVFAAMFIVLRDGLPLLRRRRQPAEAKTAETDIRDTGFFAGALLAVLIPFYGYYAGWGFLSNTLRDYSRLFLDTQLSRIDFLNPANSGPSALEMESSLWVVVAVFVIWVLRRGAKELHKRTGHRLWPLFIVACEATWALLGLHLIAGWQAQLVEWLAQLPSPRELLRWLVPAANAEVTSPAVQPVDWPAEFQLLQWLTSLFWYSALPLIWFNLGAIIYGHDLNMMTRTTERVTGRMLSRWTRLPRPVTDFISYFWGGTVKRWHAVVNGVMLAASAGVALTVSVIVLWRLADWLGRWAWIGAAQLVGPQDHLVWRLAERPLSILFGFPGQPQDGLLVVVVQFCILAAGLELAGRAQQHANVSVAQG